MNNNSENKDCIVIMPIEEVCEGYEEGHFKDVYNHVIKPSVKQAGFSPMRADDINPEIIDYEEIINKIMNAPIAIFDLSTCNDRIITGLVIRIALDMPAIVISDVYTPKFFKSKNVLYLEYEKELNLSFTYYTQISILQSIKSLLGSGLQEYYIN